MERTTKPPLTFGKKLPERYWLKLGNIRPELWEKVKREPWFIKLNKLLVDYAKTLPTDPFDLEGYVPVPRRLLGKIAKHGTAKNKLINYIILKTFGHYDKPTNSFRWLTKLPTFCELSNILGTSELDTKRAKKQLVSEKTIIEFSTGYGKGKVSWVGIHPSVLLNDEIEAQMHLDDIKQVLDKANKSQLRIDHYGLVFDMGDKEVADEMREIIKEERERQREKLQKRKEAKQPKVRQTCPFEFEFGKDWNQHDDCEHCPQKRYVECRDKCDEING